MHCDWQGKYTRISEKLWDKIEPLLPRYRPSKAGGRPRASLRGVVDGLWYILRTGCQWKELPRYYGSSSTVHRYFQEWVQLGIFRRLWKVCLQEYDRRRGIQWRWQSADGTMTKAPLGGGKNRPKSHGSR
jgi:putative transposase